MCSSREVEWYSYVGIPKGTNCAPLLAELLLHDYESNAMIRLSRTNGHPTNHARYIDSFFKQSA